MITAEVAHDQLCIRGCAQKDVHLAVCEHSGAGQEPAGACHGCAPMSCRDGSLICDRCFGRLRGLLRDAPDVLGRMQALADPLRATTPNRDRVKSSRALTLAPIDADLLDAITAIRPVVDWASYGDLAWASDRLETVEWLADTVLDRHPPVNEIHPAWSVQDAVDRWGIERADRNEDAWEDDEDRAEVVNSVPEWGDRLLSREEAEKLAGSPQTLRRWRSAGDIAPVGQIYIASVKTVLFRSSDVMRVRAEKEARKRSGLAQYTDA